MAGLILATELILPTGAIVATLRVIWVHCVIEVANDVVETLRGSRKCAGIAVIRYGGSSGAKQVSNALKDSPFIGPSGN